MSAPNGPEYPGQQPAGATPPTGAYQSYPAAQPGYPAAQAGFAAPPPGYPAGAPGYPAAPGYPGYPAAPSRPGLVTAAAVLAFIWGGFAIIASLLLAFVSAATSTLESWCDVTINGQPIEGCEVASDVTSLVRLIAIGSAIVAALLIWGGVVAMSGRNGKVLVIAAAAYALLVIVNMFAYEFTSSSLAGLVVPGLIVGFIMAAPSRAWFRAKGGATF